MTSLSTLADLQGHHSAGGEVRLFLDYDGTLVPIARSPEEAIPDAALLELMGKVAQAPGVTTTILSGRPLATLQEYFPMAGLTLAGLYGSELQWPGGGLELRAKAIEARQVVEQVLAAWAPLIEGVAGAFLEDKGSSLALHSRFAADEAAEIVLREASLAVAGLGLGDEFRLIGGRRFLEVAPAVAHKGRAVEWLIERAPLQGAAVVYMGDDDKDEEAFGVVLKHGGLPILVGQGAGPTQALHCLESPQEVRQLLAGLAGATVQAAQTAGGRSRVTARGV